MRCELSHEHASPERLMARRRAASSLPERAPRRSPFDRTKDELRAIPDLTADRERKLVRRAQGGEQAAYNELLSSLYKWALKPVGQFVRSRGEARALPPGMTAEELWSLCALMLTEKLPDYLVRFDAARGRFTTFLNRRVLGVCQDACADAHAHERKLLSLETPVAGSEEELTLQDTLADLQSPDPLDWTIAQHEALARVQRTLEGPDREILEAHADDEHESFDAIGKRLGMSGDTVRRRVRRVQDRVRATA